MDMRVHKERDLEGIEGGVGVKGGRKTRVRGSSKLALAFICSHASNY